MLLIGWCLAFLCSCSLFDSLSQGRLTPEIHHYFFVSVSSSVQQYNWIVQLQVLLRLSDFHDPRSFDLRNDHDYVFISVPYRAFLLALDYHLVDGGGLFVFVSRGWDGGLPYPIVHGESNDQ
jgi:hypothetical protein